MQVTEHEYETAEGLPGPLPQGERLLWQGKPSLNALARVVFHIRKLGLYFGAIAAWQVVSLTQDGLPGVQIAAAATWPVLIGALAIGILYLIAWVTRRTTTYTITSRRVVMRIGIALPITINLPFSELAAADVGRYRDQHGDISLKLGPDKRIAWAVLWPHARPWKLGAPEPSLRCLANVADVAAILETALHQSLAANEKVVAEPVPSKAIGPAFASG